MKRINSILIIPVLFLLSCQLDKDLDGTWIGDYSILENSDTRFPEPNLINFKSNKCYALGSKIYYGAQVRESKRIWFSNRIVFNDNLEKGKPMGIYEVVKVDKDSLVLQIPSANSNSKHIYRKLPETSKHSLTTNFVGKKFILQDIELQDHDTVYFKTDSTFISNSITGNWQRISFEGYDVVFFDGVIPLVIENQKDEEVHLKSFKKEEIKFIMKELK